MQSPVTERELLAKRKEFLDADAALDLPQDYQPRALGRFLKAQDEYQAVLKRAKQEAGIGCERAADRRE